MQGGGPLQACAPWVCDTLAGTLNGHGNTLEASLTEDITWCVLVSVVEMVLLDGIALGGRSRRTGGWLCANNKGCWGVYCNFQGTLDWHGAKQIDASNSRPIALEELWVAWV